MAAPTGTKQQEPETEEGKKNAVLENIQQLGQTNTLSGESNIFCLTIIGQVEGHIVLPPRIKRPNMST